MAENDFRRRGAALIDVLERHRTLRERTLFEPVERPEPPYEIVWCALPTTCLRDLLVDPFCTRAAVTPSHRMRLRSCRGPAIRIAAGRRSSEPRKGRSRRSHLHGSGGTFSSLRWRAPRQAMYLATEVWPTSMPSLRSSPWMRGAPQRGFARLISRISSELREAPWACRVAVETSSARSCGIQHDAIA